jgi:hypothetical protein
MAGATPGQPRDPTKAGGANTKTHVLRAGQTPFVAMTVQTDEGLKIQNQGAGMDAHRHAGDVHAACDDHRQAVCGESARTVWGEFQETESARHRA